jgi:hypothetical protein
MRTRTVVAIAALALAAASPAAASSNELGSRAVSQDGSTAIELGPRGRLDVIDNATGQVRRTLALRGDYSLDAISPDGRTVYVIRYLSADREHYAVQWLSTARADAVPHTVVEKGEPGEEMAGTAVSRDSSNEWVYTLYDGGGHTPFVHALNTAERFTVCIDLDALEGRSDLASLGVRADPNRVEVTTARGRPLVYINPGSFVVTEAPPTHAAHVAPTAPRTANAPGDDGLPAALIAALAAVVAVVLVAARRRMRLAREANDPDRAAAATEVADRLAGTGAPEVAEHHVTVP